MAHRCRCWRCGCWSSTSRGARVFAEGLARYMAVCLLGGYAWLAVGGIAWAATALGLPARDVALHALGLGFVVSMMMGHAPVILPAIARVKLLFGFFFYLPLAALHLSLLAAVRPRAAADPAWRAQGPFQCAVHRAVRGHRRGRRAGLAPQIRRRGAPKARSDGTVHLPHRGAGATRAAAGFRTLGAGLSPLLPAGQHLRRAVHRTVGAAVQRDAGQPVPAGPAVARARNAVRFRPGGDRRLPVHGRAQLEQPAHAHRLQSWPRWRCSGWRAACWC